MGLAELPINCYEDNKATYQNCVTNVFKGRLKHIETVLFKVKEYEGKKKQLKLIGMREQMADEEKVAKWKKKRRTRSRSATPTGKDKRD